MVVIYNNNGKILSVDDILSEINKLEKIREDILNDKIAIEGFNQAFKNLGIVLTASDQELIDKFNQIRPHFRHIIYFRQSF